MQPERSGEPEPISWYTNSVRTRAACGRCCAMVSRMDAIPRCSDLASPAWVDSIRFDASLRRQPSSTPRVGLQRVSKRYGHFIGKHTGIIFWSEFFRQAPQLAGREGREMAKQRTRKPRQTQTPKQTQKPKQQSAAQVRVDTFPREAEQTALMALIVFGVIAFLMVWILNAVRVSLFRLRRIAVRLASKG